VCREYSIAETTIQQMREAIDISGDGHVSQLEFNLLTVGGGLEEALQKLQRDHSGGADGVEQILPDGWERVSHRLPDGTAKAYYINHKTKTTQWEPPKALNLCGKCGCLRSPTDFSPLELEKVDGFCNACLDLTVGGGTIDKRGDCPACNKGVYANQPRSNVHGSYYHAGCLAAQSAAGGARPGTGQADTYLPEIIRPSPGAEEPEEELDDFKLPDIVGKKMENPHLVLTADESINVLVGCMSAGMHQAKQAQGKGTKLSKGSSMMVLYVDLPWR